MDKIYIKVISETNRYVFESELNDFLESSAKYIIETNYFVNGDFGHSALYTAIIKYDNSR